MREDPRLHRRYHCRRSMAQVEGLEIVRRLPAQVECAALLSDFSSPAHPVACGRPLVKLLRKHPHRWKSEEEALATMVGMDIYSEDIALSVRRA